MLQISPSETWSGPKRHERRLHIKCVKSNIYHKYIIISSPYLKKEAVKFNNVYQPFLVLLFRNKLLKF